MGWNFRKSLNLGGGLRINFSRRGIGASAGVRGLRFGVGPRGKRLQISLPGTGIYYRKDEGWGPQARSTVPSRFQSVGRLVQLGIAVIAAAGLISWLLRLLS